MIKHYDEKLALTAVKRFTAGKDIQRRFKGNVSAFYQYLLADKIRLDAREKWEASPEIQRR